MLSLTSKVTEAEAYNTSEEIKDLKLTFRGSEAGADFALFQNEPNPFKATTLIGYELPAAGNVTLTIFDVTGKVMFVKEQESVKGYNTIQVMRKDVPGIGVIAGPIVGALVGGGVGGVTGGLIGALVGMGIPESDAQAYENALREGGVVLGVHPHKDDEKAIKDYFLKHGGENVYAS